MCGPRLGAHAGASGSAVISTPLLLAAGTSALTQHAGAARLSGPRPRCASDSRGALLGGRRSRAARRCCAGASRHPSKRSTSTGPLDVHVPR